MTRDNTNVFLILHYINVHIYVLYICIVLAKSMVRFCKLNYDGWGQSTSHSYGN